MSKDASTKLYKKLADFKGTANELSIRTLDRIKVSKASGAFILLTVPTLSFGKKNLRKFEKVKTAFSEQL